MSRFKKEFPDYDAPLPTLKGWEDKSWHNDTCPSLGRDIKDEFGTVCLELYVDYLDKAKREMPEDPRFTFYTYPADKGSEDGLKLRGVDLEDLRATCIKWYLTNVGDSILEEDLTTAEILEQVGTMWGFHNMKASEDERLRLMLDEHTLSTGGGCLAYSFDHAGHFILVTGEGGCELPKDAAGEMKVVCLRDGEGNEEACINVVAPMKDLVKFLAAVGSDTF